MDLILYAVLVPMVAGFVVRIVPDALKGVKEAITLVAAAITLYITIALYRLGWVDSKLFGMTMFRVDMLSSFVLLWIGIIGLAVMLYSIGFMWGSKHLGEYYAYCLLSIGAACGIAAANDLVLLLALWVFLGLMLHLLVSLGGPKAAKASKRTFISLGGTDGLLALAVAILWMMTGSTTLSRDPIPTITGLACLTFILFACAAFARAGAVPFHGWIPDAAEAAPTSAGALLPGSLDKLVGIYLLARITLYLFNPTPAMVLVLMIVGAVTIISAVLMAFVQHDLKRLLGYDAVSQVGYMVIGIATLNPVGVAGGLFHMLNTAIYKACLFLCGGSVEKREGTTDLDRLGGLARFMPVTFFSALVASLAISGVPPFNGFVSKWMIYQGIIEMGKHGGHLWVVWLVAALFGSALTFASFAKALHSVFLGVREKAGKGPKEVGFTMWLPMLGLALVSLVFGIFAFALPLKAFILPAVNTVPALRVPAVASWLGWWSPGLATVLIIVGIVIGLLIYLAGRVKAVRVDSAYVGGELLPREARVTGTGFYNTIADMGFFRAVYKAGEKTNFDIYEVAKYAVAGLGRALKALHTGLFSGFVTWLLAGAVVILALLLR